MITFYKAEFNKLLQITNIDYLSPQEEIHLAGEGIFIGTEISKILSTPLKDFIECLVNNRLIGLPSELCNRISVKESS